EEGLGTGFLPAGLRGAQGRPSSPRRGKPFRSGVDQTVRELTCIANLSIGDRLWVDRCAKNRHLSTETPFWMDAQPEKGLISRPGDALRDVRPEEGLISRPGDALRDVLPEKGLISRPGCGKRDS
ncbi:MAG: hypothetical protein J6T09_06600, partial [Bacteroidales bacterium]|nr:hypothetical protein [Bacteroidales bacterium]